MIIVTGATGFLGSVFIPQLAKKSASKVLCMVPDSETVRMAGKNISENNLMEQYTQLGVGILRYPAHGGIDDYKKAFSELGKISTVVYMAANNNQNANYSELYKDNVEVLRLFIESLGERLDGAQLIFTSSVMAKACNDMLGSGFSTESLQKTSPYGLSKLMAEKTIVEYSKRFNFKPLILRLASLYGKNASTGFMFSVGRLAGISKKIPIPYFSGKMGVLNADDLAMLLTNIVESKRNYEDEYYYVDDCHPAATGELIKHYGLKRGFETKQVTLPKYAVRTVSKAASIGAKFGFAAALKLLSLYKDIFVAHDTRIWNITGLRPEAFLGGTDEKSKTHVQENGVRVAITGATGLIGQKLVRGLSDKGFIVRCGVHSNGSMPIGRNVDLMECDVSSAASVTSFVRGQDIVIHAAALTPARGKYTASEYNKVNVDGTSNVIDGCLKSGVKKLVFFSSEAAHSSAKGNYGKTKYAAEKKVIDSDLNWIVLKPGQVVGEKGYIPKLATKLKDGAPFLPVPENSPKNLELVGIKSLIDSVVKIVSDETRMYNRKVIYMGCTERVNVEQVADKMCDILNKRPFKLGLPQWFFRIVASMPLSPINTDTIDSLYTPLPDDVKDSIRMADEPWENVLKHLIL